MLLQALSLHLLPLFFSPDCHCYRQASTYPARFTISTLQQTPFLLYTNRLVQIKLPAPPANTAEGGKASLQPKCTVSMSEGLRTAPPSCFPVQQANLFVTSKLKAAQFQLCHSKSNSIEVCTSLCIQLNHKAQGYPLYLLLENK